MALTLRDLGVRFVRRAPHFHQTARWIYTRLPQAFHDTPASWLKHIFRRQVEVTFIQIGAFDGVAGDPIRSIVLSHPGWRGVLVEPQPRAFQQLQGNYASASHRLQFLNCAVSDFSGCIDMYELEESEIEKLKLPAWSREVASTDESHVVRHFPSARRSKRSVPAMRVSEILDEYDLPKVDLIVMDVEGHERRIIEDIDFANLGVHALVFEHKHMTEIDHEAVIEHLKSFGFTLRRYGRDTVAYI